MYRVVRAFADAYDGEHIYAVGDVYPRVGLSVDARRLEELSSNRNGAGVVFIIDEDPEEAIPKSEEKPEKDVLEVETGVDPPSDLEAKGRSRKRRERYVRADS